MTFQVYLNSKLAKSLVAPGTKIGVWLPVPSGGVARCEVGSVDPSEVNTDFSGSLPSAPQRRVKLQWSGGVFQAADIVGFRIYGEATPGGGINYAAKLADITAYPAGIVHDGYGNGGYGLFGYGNDGGTYTWTSDPLTSGTWSFGIKPYDEAGNEGTAVTKSQAIAVPPLPPAPFSDGTRLHYTLASGRATLTWNASPG